jgi:hypothetical protein
MTPCFFSSIIGLLAQSFRLEIDTPSRDLAMGQFVDDAERHTDLFVARCNASKLAHLPADQLCLKAGLIFGNQKANYQNFFRITKSVVARYPKPRSSTAIPLIAFESAACTGSKRIAAPRKRKQPPVMIPNTSHPGRFLSVCIPIKITKGPARAQKPPVARKNNRAGSPMTMIKMLIHQRLLAVSGFVGEDRVVAYFIAICSCDMLFSSQQTSFMVYLAILVKSICS